MATPFTPFLTLTATIKRKVVAVGDSLGVELTATTAARGSLPTLLSCQLQPMSQRQVEAASQRHGEVSHRCYFDQDPQTDGQDMLTISSVDYEVRGIPRSEGGLGETWRVLCLESDLDA